MPGDTLCLSVVCSYLILTAGGNRTELWSDQSWNSCLCCCCLLCLNILNIQLWPWSQVWTSNTQHGFFLCSTYKLSVELSLGAKDFWNFNIWIQRFTCLLSLSLSLSCSTFLHGLLMTDRNVVIAGNWFSLSAFWVCWFRFYGIGFTTSIYIFYLVFLFICVFWFRFFLCSLCLYPSRTVSLDHYYLLGLCKMFAIMFCVADTFTSSDWLCQLLVLWYQRG